MTDDLAEKAVPAIPRAMGRKPLGVKVTNVRLYKGDDERIDAVQGKPNKRAEFIREIVNAELDRRERKD